jgi:hypothetical protein
MGGATRTLFPLKARGQKQKGRILGSSTQQPASAEAPHTFPPAPGTSYAAEFWRDMKGPAPWMFLRGFPRTLQDLVDDFSAAPLFVMPGKEPVERGPVDPENLRGAGLIASDLLENVPGVS